jgi:hypothetical protein
MTTPDKSELLHLSNEIMKEQVKYEEAIRKDENLEIKKTIRLKIKALKAQLEEICKNDGD